MKFSVVIIVKDGANTIEQALNALCKIDDVVVYDNGSTDGTQDIARKYKNVHLVEGPFSGFGPTKNKAASFAKHDWILALDSDEVADEELITDISNKQLDIKKIYSINRQTCYKDIKIKYCGWNNEKIKRFYNKTVTQFNDNFVHEDILSHGFEIEELKGNIQHYSYTSISDFIIKMDRYSTLFAEEKRGKKKSSPVKAISSSIFAFFQTYIFRKGFLDGYAGLLIAYTRANVVFYKYIKLYELNKKNGTP